MEPGSQRPSFDPGSTIMLINLRIIGLLAVLGGIAVYVGTLGFREIPGQIFGSAFFPRILAGALILCGGALAARATPGDAISVGPMLRGWSGIKVVVVLASIIIWTSVAPALGFIPTTALLIAGLALLAGGSAVPSLATGSAVSIILYLIFGKMLRVPLPRGVIESLLP